MHYDQQKCVTHWWGNKKSFVRFSSVYALKCGFLWRNYWIVPGSWLYSGYSWVALCVSEYHVIRSSRDMTTQYFWYLVNGSIELVYRFMEGPTKLGNKGDRDNFTACWQQIQPLRMIWINMVMMLTRTLAVRWMQIYDENTNHKQPMCEWR